ncbi:hypothetical protein QBC46DRAFT_382767 [Diplogelasinospora grovesii]|uniref:Smr domain-containing protein n=1 Tax=Diplogelasinospora grovesii TaxID=303347 RepID=A0AAN6N948_9PEZI|nr:hypothetical protein QBC46DRAFT_382767 [Diplogelasinospora grovesii]
MGDATLIALGNTKDEGELLETKLVEEFGAALDESLILAIANDLDIQTQYEEIRNVLIPLAESARLEEATGFDPSGLSSDVAADLKGLTFDEDATGTSGNGMSGPESLTTSTENATTIYSGSSDSADTLGFSDDQTNLDDSEKIEGLRHVFSNFKDHTIRFVLREAGGDLDVAFDLLLSRQYLEEEGHLPKGVDGFYAFDDERPSHRVRKGSSAKAENGQNRVFVDYSVVSSTIDNDDLEAAEGVAKPKARPLKQHAPSSTPNFSMMSRPPQVHTPIVRLSNSTATPGPKIAHPPGWQVVPNRKKKKKAAGAAPAPPPALASASEHDGGSMPRGSTTRTAAAKLARMGPLGRQGVYAYTERCRDEVLLSSAKAFAAAERHVNQQSTSSRIDLHGVRVLDGVRIAKTRVRQWWDGLGDGYERERAAKQHGFTVITGIGLHSANGDSRLRRAVGTALKNDGWKVETLTGQFYITGRVTPA